MAYSNEDQGLLGGSSSESKIPCLQSTTAKWISGLAIATIVCAGVSLVYSGVPTVTLTADGAEKEVRIAQANLEQRGIVQFADPDKSTWSCIDGRTKNTVFGTPGGDAGEFVTALSPVLKEARIPQGEIASTTQDIFLQYMDEIVTTKRPFYMHTDEKSMDAAKAFFTEKYPTAKFGKMLDADSDVQDFLANEVVTGASFTGCGHLKLMMGNPSGYGVPKECSTSLILSFFQYAWGKRDGKTDLHAHDHGKLNHAILPGAHEEIGILQVLGDHADHDHGSCKSPKIMPNQPSAKKEDGEKRNQYFVNHSSGGIIQGLRRQNVKFFMEKLGVDSSKEEALLKAVNDLAAKQLGLTATALAPTLPMINTEVEHGSVKEQC